MKRSLTLIGFILVTQIVFFACKAKPEAENETSSDTLNTKMASSDSSGCVAGKAVALAKKSVYPGAVFALNADGRTGTETMDLNKGERLIITSHGCHYFQVTFRFETERFQGDTTNTVDWLTKSATLLKEVANGMDTPFDMKAGSDAISRYMSSLPDPSYYLGDAIVVDAKEMRDLLSLTRVQKIDDKRYAVEVSYEKGPGKKMHF